MRSFRLEKAALEGPVCDNITAATDQHFRPSPRVLQCWQIRLSGDSLDGQRAPVQTVT